MGTAHLFDCAHSRFDEVYRIHCLCATQTFQNPEQKAFASSAMLFSSLNSDTNLMYSSYINIFRLFHSLTSSRGTLVTYSVTHILGSRYILLSRVLHINTPYSVHVKHFLHIIQPSGYMLVRVKMRNHQSPCTHLK